MSLPEEDQDERDMYPYYMLLGYEELPFKTKEDRQLVNTQVIPSFIDAMNSQMAKSEKF